MTEVKVSGLAYDSLRKMPVVFLKEAEGNRVLPIWIGLNEALSIAIGLENVKPERPLTHDLTKSVIDGLNASVIKIVVNDIRNSTYYARIYLKSKNSVTEIDARPSDSIALAVRASAPMYVREKVLDAGATFTLNEEDDLKKHFQELEIEDFGKFKL